MNFKAILLSALLLNLLLVTSLPSAALASPKASKLNAESEFKHHVNTQHFCFYYNTDEALAQRMAKFSEAFFHHVYSDLFHFDWPSRVNVYMTADIESQLAFTKKYMNYNRPMAGVIFPEKNAIVFYTTSGFGTASHEIFNFIEQRALKNADSFTCNSTFFEKLYGYRVDKSNSVIYWGFQNPWRLEEVEKELPDIRLSELMKSSNADELQGQKRLLAMFLYDKHKLKKYFELVAANNRGKYSTFLEATLEQRITDIEPEWHSYQEGIVKNIEKFKQLPNSEYFLSKKDFDRFLKENKSIVLKTGT